MSTWHELWYTAIGYAGLLLASLIVLAVLTLIWRPPAFRWLPMVRLRPGRWSGSDVAFAFLLLLGVPVVVASLLSGMGFFQAIFQRPPSAERQQLWVLPLSLLIIVASILAMLHGSSRTRPGHLGLTTVQWLPNLWRGWAAYATLTPLVYAIFLLTILLLGEGSAHSLKNLAKEDLTYFEWGLLFMQASVLGPIAEELLFRGVLLGWLRRASFVGHAVVALTILLVGLAFGFSVDGQTLTILPGPLALGFACALIYGLCIGLVWRPVLEQGSRYFFPQSDDTGGDVALKRDEPRWRKWLQANARLGILGSAILFGLAHAQVWPTPIPMIALGIGLSWLAVRTQSLVGPMFCHGLFNAVACFTLLAPQPSSENGNDVTRARLDPPAASSVNSVPGSWLPRRR